MFQIKEWAVFPRCYPFTLTVVANPTTVTVGTPASVNFAVE
ncbi:hypothetical protein [Candidatus Methanoperedens sp. BLZ2]|nr:hypothetical protein [Candidatus Methanoperedens sp. BLZ2]